MSWGDEQEEQGPVFADVETWVSEWLAPHYRRSFDSGSLTWCPRWLEHPEAQSRLTGLWLAWEQLATQDKGTGLASWWISYADPTMDALLDQAGPFKGCRNGHSDRLEPLPLDDAGARSTS